MKVSRGLCMGSREYVGELGRDDAVALGGREEPRVRGDVREEVTLMRSAGEALHARDEAREAARDRLFRVAGAAEVEERVVEREEDRRFVQERRRARLDQ